MDEKELNVVLERYFNRFNKYNTKVLQKLGDIIKQFQGLSPSEAYKLSQKLKYGEDLDEIVNEISKMTDLSVKDIYETFDNVAKKNLDFAEVYYKAKNKEFIDYKNNIPLQRIAKGIAKQTSKELINITNTKSIGFVLYDKNTRKKVFKPLKNVYYDLLDEAVYNSSLGIEDYQSAMRDVIRGLANSGIKTHEEKINYASGYSRRIDSSVRQAVLTGIRQINLEVQKQVGEEFGADGYEISVHELCAIDHQDIQGRQYSKKEYKRLNNRLVRPIGELNCKHFAFAIVMGVSRPDYTKKQLQEIKNRSNESFEYDGNKYTKYEATQEQRRIEMAIRKQKDYQIIAKASGDNDAILQAQNKITILNKKYKDFSEKAGLPTYKQRLIVSGYQRIAKSKLR